MATDWQKKMEIRGLKTSPLDSEPMKAAARQVSLRAITDSGLRYCQDVEKNIDALLEFQKDLYADLQGLKMSANTSKHLDPLIKNVYFSIDQLNEPLQHLKRMEGKLTRKKGSQNAAEDFISFISSNDTTIFKINDILMGWHDEIVKIHDEISAHERQGKSELRSHYNSIFMYEYPYSLATIEMIQSDLYASRALAEKQITLHSETAGISSGATR